MIFYSVVIKKIKTEDPLNFLLNAYICLKWVDSSKAIYTHLKFSFFPYFFCLQMTIKKNYLSNSFKNSIEDPSLIVIIASLKC